MKPFTVVCDSRISGSCGLRHIAQYPGIPLDGGCQVRRRSTEVVSPCNISYSFSGRRGSADQLHAREMKLCPGYHGVNSRENGRDNTARRPLLRMPGHGSGRVLPIVARASMAACASAAPLQRGIVARPGRSLKPPGAPRAGTCHGVSLGDPRLVPVRPYPGRRTALLPVWEGPVVT